MRKLFVAVTLILGSLTLAHAASFEGLIDYEMHDEKNKTVPLHYEVKEPRLRVSIEHEGKTAVIIFDPPQNAMYILVADHKMAMKSSIPKPSEQKQPASSKKATFTNTGKTDTVAGHTCMIYAFTSDSAQGEVCSAEGMGTFYFASGQRPGSASESKARENMAREKGLFPLRVTSTDSKNGKTFTIVATHIEKKSVADSEFIIPSDYHIMQGYVGTPGGSAAGFNAADFKTKMMNATPEERQKMIEDMRKQYGGDTSH